MASGCINLNKYRPVRGVLLQQHAAMHLSVFLFVSTYLHHTSLYLPLSSKLSQSSLIASGIQDLLLAPCVDVLSLLQ